MSIKFLLVQISTVLFSFEKHFKTSNDINYLMSAVCEVKNFRSKHKRIIQEITLSNVYTIFEINLNRKKNHNTPPKEDDKEYQFFQQQIKKPQGEKFVAVKL